ncbi:unnamed protein product, partial [Polarella glacialis]
ALPGSGGVAGGVRLVVFDFDQTLSVIHVFKSLAGWSEDGPVQIPKPHASTERGQVRRIRELDQTGAFQERFATVAFGGPARVEQVRNCLLGLREKGAELVICTKGLIGAVRRCLSDLELLSLFSEVYGNIGGEIYGATPYDRQVAMSRDAAGDELLGQVNQANWGTKPELIVRLMRERRLRRDQVVLVEDDPEEIRKAGPVCRTLFVREAAGITQAAMDALQRMVAPVPGDTMPSTGGSAGEAARLLLGGYANFTPLSGCFGGAAAGGLLGGGGSIGKRQRGTSQAREQRKPSSVAAPQSFADVPSPDRLELCPGGSAARLGVRNRSGSVPPGAAPLPPVGPLPPLRRPPRVHDEPRRLG